MRNIKGLACFLLAAVFTGLWPVVGFGQSQKIEKDATEHPNLVFVIVDQMRGSAMGFLGQEPVVTPRLDAFSKQAIVFTEVVSNYPICSPFRAMWMSGQYPHRNGVINNCMSKSTPYGVALKTDARCWSDVLKDNGYWLGYLGKWHLEAPHKPFIDCSNNRGKTAWNEWTPPERRHGFDYWYAYNTFNRHLRPLYWDNDAGREAFHYVDQWGPTHEADKAIEIIENRQSRFRNPEQPFALVVSMNPPHMPYHLHPKKYLKPYAELSDKQLSARPNIPPAGTRWGDYYRKNIRHYYAMITGIDEQFGRILAALDKAGLAEKTVVVFCSDHGNCLGIHDSISKNVPVEESMRIPLLIRYPGKLRPRRTDLLISVPDLYPTLLDLMGFGRQIPDEVEGTSHAELLRTGNGKRPTSQLYLRIPCAHPEWGARGVRTRQYTLVVEREDNEDKQILLYDNSADPFQRNNIAAERPKIVERLIREELVPWLRKTGDPFFP